MILVQGLDGYPVLLGHDNGIRRRLGSLDSCDVGHMVVHSAAPDLVAVLYGLRGGGRVDYQLDLAAFHVVQDVGAAIEDLIHPFNAIPDFFRYSAVPSVAMIFRPASESFLAATATAALSSSLTEMKTIPSRGRLLSADELRLEEGQAQVVVYAHYLAS